MDKVQFRFLIVSIILSAIILSIGISLQNGIWEFRELKGYDYPVYAKFNIFTGESQVRVKYPGSDNFGEIRRP